MSWTGLFAAAAVTIPTAAAPDPAPLSDWSAPLAASRELSRAEISILTYNVRGLPWPVAGGRAEALRAIGQELARLRRDGRQPDVVLIQEGFRGEIADLVRISGYRYWARGPVRSDRASRAADQAAPATWNAVRYPLRGEGWGKLTGSGLHVLSDLPITRVESAVYRHCAGFDCLASKGVMLVRLSLPGGRSEIDVVNTHLNTKRKAGVPRTRTLRAHQLQTDELLAFLGAHRSHGRPVLIGGDFNMRNAPERYAYRAAARPYQVVAEFCSKPAADCLGPEPAAAEPWLKSQDLQAFTSSPSAEVRPIRVGELFRDEGDGGRLSDHTGYLVRYRIQFSSKFVHRRESDRAVVAQRLEALGEAAVIRASWKTERPAE